MGLERCKTCGTWWDAEFPLNKCPKCINHVESDPFQEIKEKEPEKKKSIITGDRLYIAGKVALIVCIVVLISLGIYMRYKGIHYYDIFTSFKR